MFCGITIMIDTKPYTQFTYILIFQTTKFLKGILLCTILAHFLLLEMNGKHKISSSCHIKFFHEKIILKMTMKKYV